MYFNNDKKLHEKIKAIKEEYRENLNDSAYEKVDKILSTMENKFWNTINESKNDQLDVNILNELIRLFSYEA